MKSLPVYLLIYCLPACSHRQPTITGLEGKLIPKFDMLLIDSITNFSTSNIPTGKSIALFYFSPRCPYCKAEMSELLENMNELKGTQFYMITNFPFSEMRQFYTEYKLINYSNVTIGYDPPYFFANYFKTNVVPYMAIYGKDKKLKGVYVGLAKSKDIEKLANE